MILCKLKIVSQRWAFRNTVWTNSIYAIPANEMILLHSTLYYCTISWEKALKLHIILRLDPLFCRDNCHIPELPTYEFFLIWGDDAILFLVLC